MSQKIVVVAHNIRSTFNVGALFRLCDGLGIDQLILSGYTPYPKTDGDDRLPHIADKLTKQIDKTALGAIKTIKWHQQPDIIPAIVNFEKQGYSIVALEQHENSTNIVDFMPHDKVVLILGEEIDGVNADLIELADTILEIPMKGQKESFNVASAASMALFYISLIK